MRKLERGSSRPTENAAMSLATASSADEWCKKIREANKPLDGVNIKSNLDRVTVIIDELIREVKAGRVDRKVVTEVAKREHITGLLRAVYEK